VSADLEKIGPTAHYTAYAWYRLGLPYAELFATKKGARLFWSFRLAGEWIAVALPNVPSMIQYLAQRHLAIEHALDEFEPDVIIELGAGLSRRGLTRARNGTRYVEIDFPYMIEAKRARIPEALRTDLLRHESMNILSPEFAERLAALIGDAKRPAIIAEGVLGYFHPEQRMQLVHDLARTVRNGIFLCDLRSREGGVQGAAKLLRMGIKLITGGRGTAEDFESEASIADFFARAGFVSAEPIDLREIPEAPQVKTPARVWRAHTPAA
jgi:O-methyltransferase involved in polyketide biosynthesis